MSLTRWSTLPRHHSTTGTAITNTSACKVQSYLRRLRQLRHSQWQISHARLLVGTNKSCGKSLLTDGSPVWNLHSFMHGRQDALSSTNACATRQKRSTRRWLHITSPMIVSTRRLTCTRYLRRVCSRRYQVSVARSRWSGRTVQNLIPVAVITVVSLLQTRTKSVVSFLGALARSS